MLFPARTGDGVPEFVAVRLTAAPTVVVTVVVLLVFVGSPVVDDKVEVAVMTDPLASLAFTLTVTSMLATVPAGNPEFVQVTVPVAPTAGVEQLHPAGNRTDW